MQTTKGIILHEDVGAHISNDTAELFRQCHNGEAQPMISGIETADGQKIVS
jgi:hypothetical protein